MSRFKISIETLKSSISRTWRFILDTFGEIDRVACWFDSAAINFVIPISVFAGGAAVTLIAFVPDIMMPSFNVHSMMDILSSGISFGGAAMALAFSVSSFQLVVAIPTEAKERHRLLYIVTTISRLVGLWAIIVGLSAFTDGIDHASDAFLSLLESKAETR